MPSLKDLKGAGSMIDSIVARGELRSRCLWEASSFEDHWPDFIRDKIVEAWCQTNCRGEYHGEFADRVENTMKVVFRFADPRDLVDFQQAMDSGLF